MPKPQFFLVFWVWVYTADFGFSAGGQKFRERANRALVIVL